MAAEQRGQPCYGIEIDPQYCAIALERWERVTCRKAVLLPALKKKEAVEHKRRNFLHPD